MADPNEDEIKAAFLQYDKNGDGHIELKELGKFLRVHADRRFLRKTEGKSRKIPTRPNESQRFESASQTVPTLQKSVPSCPNAVPKRPSQGWNVGWYYHIPSHPIPDPMWNMGYGIKKSHPILCLNLRILIIFRSFWPFLNKFRGETYFLL